ncbi:MAG: hypothetical protein SX243_13060 [Acidobacteriota bacterium]|nr:hypothetical protein [Acidobacteriota bacterium]
MDKAITDEDRRRLLPRAGLCASCRHLRLLSNRRSVFVYCRKSEDDSRFPRYPPLPVRSCSGHEPADGWEEKP